MSRLQFFGACGFLAVLAFYVVISLHWPIVWDAAVMHYVVFLMRHGFRPYAQISDFNLPGTYLCERWAMALFGSSDLSWRIYEDFLMALLSAGCLGIAGRRRWYAGVFAATFFIAMHGSEGPLFVTERDEIMTALLIASAAAFLVAVRHRRPVLMLAFGVFAGMAILIKPTALLFDVGVPLLMWAYLRKIHQRVGRYMAAAFLGNLAVAFLLMAFLLRYHAAHALLFQVRTAVPAYETLLPQTPVHLLFKIAPISCWLLLVLSGIVAALLRSKLSLEKQTVLFGALVGAVSYFVQRKGILYHRYAFVTFAAVWVGLEAVDAIRASRPLVRASGAAIIAYLLLVAVPYYGLLTYRSERSHFGHPAALALTLANDLHALGGPELQKQVLCLDLVNGCLSALYRSDLVEYVPFTGDLQLFAKTSNPVAVHYRSVLMEKESRSPSEVVVLGNEWFGQTSFQKVAAWPEFADFLTNNFQLVAERRFNGPAYRIYLKQGSRALLAEQQHPLK